MCAERKPEITFSHFHCSRIGLLQNQGIGTPTHYAAHFFSCCCEGASTHSCFLQHLPIENRFFGGENLKSVNAVRVFHLGHQNRHHHFRLFNFEWETLHYFDSFVALMIFKIATRQTNGFSITFFFNFKIFALSKTRFPPGRCRRMPEFASPRSAPITKNNHSRNAWGVPIPFFLIPPKRQASLFTKQQWA